MTQQNPAGRDKIDFGDLQQKLMKQIKVLEIERNLAGRRGFWKGLAAGLLVVTLAWGGLGLYVWQNPLATVEWAAENFAMEYIEKIFAGFPEAYMTNNRERVLQTLDEFTNAMQNQRVSRDDFRAIARQALGAMKDQRLTYQEMDGILEKLHQAAQAQP